eukprot:3676674-Pleurochrysis_carterae.AAC.1
MSFANMQLRSRFPIWEPRKVPSHICYTIPARAAANEYIAVVRLPLPKSYAQHRRTGCSA